MVEPDRDLRHPGRSPSNFARNTDPQIETLLQTGPAAPPTPQTRAQAYQQVAKHLNKDLPYIWNDRATWAVIANAKVQNWNNPTTPVGGQGPRHGRGDDLAHPDLARPDPCPARSDGTGPGTHRRDQDATRDEPAP